MNNQHSSSVAKVGSFTWLQRLWPDFNNELAQAEKKKARKKVVIVKSSIWTK